jgi:hypothetical protein
VPPAACVKPSPKHPPVPPPLTSVLRVAPPDSSVKCSDEPTPRVAFQVSGGLFRHQDVSKVQVAEAIIRGISDEYFAVTGAGKSVSGFMRTQYGVFKTVLAPRFRVQGSGFRVQGLGFS